MASETQPTECANSPQHVCVLGRRVAPAVLPRALLAGVCLAVFGAAGLAVPPSPAMAQSAASSSTADAMPMCAWPRPALYI